MQIDYVYNAKMTNAHNFKEVTIISSIYIMFKNDLYKKFL